MVDATRAAEGNHITPELVRSSPTKKLLISNPGHYDNHQEFGERLVLEVEIDKKRKEWRPNRPTCANLVTEWGAETSAWVGKMVKLTVQKMSNGKDGVLGVPLNARDFLEN